MAFYLRDTATNAMTYIPESQIDITQADVLELGGQYALVRVPDDDPNIEIIDVPAAFTEQSVRFQTDKYLKETTSPIYPTTAPEWMFFFSAVLYSHGRQGIIRLNEADKGFDIWDGQFRARFSETAEEGTAMELQSRPFTVTGSKRVTFLATSRIVAGVQKYDLYSIFEGESLWTHDQDVPAEDSAKPSVMTYVGYPGYTLGAKHNYAAPGHFLNASVFRVAFWAGAGGTVPDPGLASVRAKFFDATTASIVDPTTATTAYGSARVDKHGHDWTAASGGLNGDFDVTVLPTND